jgi:hypothetical protein
MPWQARELVVRMLQLLHQELSTSLPAAATQLPELPRVS